MCPLHPPRRHWRERPPLEPSRRAGPLPRQSPACRPPPPERARAPRPPPDRAACSTGDPLMGGQGRVQDWRQHCSRSGLRISTPRRRTVCRQPRDGNLSVAPRRQRTEPGYCEEHAEQGESQDDLDARLRTPHERNMHCARRAAQRTSAYSRAEHALPTRALSPSTSRLTPGTYATSQSRTRRPLREGRSM